MDVKTALRSEFSCTLYSQDVKGAGIDSLITIDIHNKNIFKQAPFKTFFFNSRPLFSQEIINYKTKP